MANAVKTGRMEEKTTAGVKDPCEAAEEGVEAVGTHIPTPRPNVRKHTSPRFWQADVQTEFPSAMHILPNAQLSPQVP